ncbi:DUF4881 domain-containing protein [Megalodesulfovibrio gigas]|uniref:Putative lipoprotein n=1 Tax=Megalodesulfovibrio gigas (strain ATCC 19364 / DSM 1382 / NCIMB 9332 / VKM B-1759) TaxID=1121448 RepID=T2GF58_MEGG1|nr:DUF4881 domain-containing protein [Megalodesulfovibrio gigas]AGW14756.1 putative lipoprotein [Megalodesulfovibrio gigas DSM 1382 = ATCC 19364]
MRINTILTRIALLLLPVLLWGCDYGNVIQGRVVEFNKETGIITFIKEESHDRKNPRYTALPPVTMRMPKDPHEIGPLPTPGGRIELNVKDNFVLVYDHDAKNFKKIPFTPVDIMTDVGRSHPMVAGKTFPIIEKDKRTVQVYSGRQRLLAKFTVDDDAIQLPDNTWIAGDEVRIFYKEEGQAARFMNITLTDIYKK